MACILAAAVGSSASAQWRVVVLEPGTINRNAKATCVSATREGGSYDDGYSKPRLWRGSAASGITLAEPGPDSGAHVYAITETLAFGEGYVRTGPTSGYYAALLWNADGSAVTILPPPEGYSEAEGYGAGGDQQVGVIRGDYGPRPVMWTGTPESLVDLLPAGFTEGEAVATDGVQQVGAVWGDVDDAAALWTGTAASFVNLQPVHLAQWHSSIAAGVSQGLQVGSVSNDDTSHASVWQGSGASFVDIHPAGVTESEAAAISRGHICGTVEILYPGDVWQDRAAYWSSPSAASYVDLHALLPSHYEDSVALGIWSDGAGIVRIVGEAYNAATGSDDAILWTNEPVQPVLGACCIGAVCTITLSNECAGLHQEGVTTCAPQTCCDVPIGSPLAAQDCDGDLLRDVCQPLGDDCNGNGAGDPCETLQFTASSFASGNSGFEFNGDALIEGGVVVLTSAVGDQMGTIIHPPLTSGATQRFRAIFDFRISQPSAVPADGISLSLMDADLHPTSELFGEDGLAGNGVITIKFNTFENDLGEGANSMFIRYNGSDVAQNTMLPFALVDAQWHRAVVDLTPGGGVTVRLGTQPGDMVTVFNDVQLPGYVPFRANIGFGGRTGGFHSKQQVANIRLAVSGPNDVDGDGTPDVCACPADFNQSGLLSVQDIFDFLAGFFAGDARADFNNSGAITVQDIFDYLAAYFAGCP